MKRLGAALLVLATALALPLRPLWVDEIFQLEGTWHQTYPQLLHNAMVAPGGMPLAYAAQKFWLDVAGFSPLQARVPAFLFGTGSVIILLWTARILKLYVPLAVLLGVVTPLLFRYSTEARPYSQGLFFSVLSTALFLRWLAQPSTGRIVAYALSCLAGIYSQPFSLFIPCAHAAYLLLYQRKRLLPIAAILAATVVLYAPWVILSHRALAAESWPHEMFFSLAQVSPLMMIREISGGGYVCSLALLILGAYGLWKRPDPLLTMCLLLPVVLAVAADAVFNYFFAIRQLIFVLPPLLLLATSGAMGLWKDRRRAAVTLGAVFLVGALTKDIRWEMDRKEDWGKAAAAIESQLQGTSGCVKFIPEGDAKHYYFFDRGLQVRTCHNDSPVLLAVSPYAPASQRKPGSGRTNVGNTLLEQKSPN